jgi:hypothetical protein
MSEHRIEPQDVINLVEDYVMSELSDAEKYSNRKPLDESGIFDLHRLAAEVYAAGWKAGDFAAATREAKVRARERDARRHDEQTRIANGDEPPALEAS